jgi:aryl-alcohol dehydrogenase-like predicted oxidoreductase
MEYRPLGRTGVHVSKLCLGTMMFGAWGNADHDDSIRIIHSALDAGINFVDTADVYSAGESEEIVGKALKGRRDDIVLATKLGVPMDEDINHRGGSRRWIITEVENSLRRLGTDRIDLYQLHMPDKKTPITETIGALGELVAEGKLREFGCSNFSVDQLEEAAAATPAGSPGFVSVQNQYNILYREPEDGVLDWCNRTGTAFLPFFPLASGLLSGKYRPGQPHPQGTRITAMGERAASQLSDERLATVAALDDLAQGEGHGVLDLAFGWLLSRPAVASVIAGAMTPEQVAGNVAAGAWQPSADVLAAVDTLAPR